MGRTLGLIAVTLVGVPLAFFTVVNALFTDAGGPSDHALALIVTGIGYLVVATTAAFMLRTEPRHVAIALATPAVLMGGLYTLREPGVAVLAAMQLAAAVATSLSGTTFGARLRQLLDERAGRA